MKKLYPIAILALTLAFTSCSKKTVLLSNGDVCNDIFYKQGSIKPFTGQCYVTYEDGKSIRETIKFEKGISNGKAVSYYKSGVVKRTGDYVNGKMNGIWEQWYANGVKEFEVRYSNDSMSGNYKLWHNNGQLKEEGNIKNNKRKGLWKFYNETGTLVMEKQYQGASNDLTKLGQIGYMELKPQVF